MTHQRALDSAINVDVHMIHAANSQSSSDRQTARRYFIVGQTTKNVVQARPAGTTRTATAFKRPSTPGKSRIRTSTRTTTLKKKKEAMSEFAKMQAELWIGKDALVLMTGEWQV